MTKTIFLSIIGMIAFFTFLYFIFSLPNENFVGAIMSVFVMLVIIKDFCNDK